MKAKKNNKHDGLIFDVDGTLWNASNACAQGWNVGLKKLGINKKIIAKQIESVTGNVNSKCVDILLPGLKKEYPNLLNVLDKAEIDMIKKKGGNFYPGVLDGIKRLAMNYKIFLVSNCTEDYLRIFLKFSKLKPYLSGFDCNGISGQSKG